MIRCFLLNVLFRRKQLAPADFHHGSFFLSVRRLSVSVLRCYRISSSKLVRSISNQSSPLKSSSSNILKNGTSRFQDINAISTEVWKEILEFPRYEVSSFGNIRNKVTGKLMSTRRQGKQSYSLVKLSSVGKLKDIYVHQLVASAFLSKVSDKEKVSHIDKNLKNNHISNLRYVNASEYKMGTELRSDNTSGIKGVSYHKGQNKWQAHIRLNYKLHHLGYFKNIEDAAKARKTAAKELFGEEYLHPSELK
jgi:hypothetical protein